MSKSQLFSQSSHSTQTSQCTSLFISDISPVYICMAVYNLQKVHQKDADVRDGGRLRGGHARGKRRHIQCTTQHTPQSPHTQQYTQWTPRARPRETRGGLAGPRARVRLIGYTCT